MALSATRFALATMLLGTSAISAHAGWFDFTSSKKAPAKDEKPAASASAALPGTSLEDSVGQAQALRLSGNYVEAIKHLSQVMMVASDDPRVVSEYGKTLAAMGRAQDAVNFLTRAGQLQPNDWTVFSALGVAYDQLGNQKDAMAAYEHALALKPGEPSVLSNYALSRMLANDPAMARKLAGRAEIANASAHDTKIAANIALIRSTAPETPGASFAVNTPAPVPMPSMAPQAAPRMPPNPVPQAASSVPMASNAPRPLIVPADNGMIQATPQMAQAPSGVVMQRVPVDPLAGPVQGAAKAGPVMGPAIAAAKAPRPLAPVAAKSGDKPAQNKDSAMDMSTARSESPRPVPANATAPGVKSAATQTTNQQAEDLQARAEAMAKQLTNKPAAIAAAKVEASKEPVRAEANGAPRVLPAPVKAADAKPAAPVAHVLSPAPVKTADAKPVSAPAPHVLPPAPVKTADAKPAPVPAPHVLPEKTAAAPAPVKIATAPAPKVLPTAAKTAAAKPKDAVPALRVSSTAY